MSAALSFLSAVFWGLIVLSVLVFIHEGGHYLAARAFGVRVTEFMLGLPCRWRLSFKSRRVGTEIGVTPVLLGGYNRICGMEPVEELPLAAALASVQAWGRASVEEVASDLGVSGEEALSCLVTLSDWASIEPYYDPELGERPEQKEWPRAFQTLARDASMLTEYDRGHDMGADGSTRAGEARPVEGDPEDFLAAERSHTYLGKGFLKRLAILVCGPLVNVLFAFLVVTVAFSAVGLDVASDAPRIGGVTEGSLAAECGLEDGDYVEAVYAADGSAGVTVDDWSSLVGAMRPYLDSGDDFQLSVQRDGQETQVFVTQAGEPHDKLGITSSTEKYHPGLAQSAGIAVRYAQTVAEYVAQLIVPQKTMEVLDQSSSIVGISVMASQAASEGLLDLVMVAASISMSLGFMNLLPIPPLDGGKILIEAIQALTRRQLSLKAQNAISYVGLAFFVFVFVVVLKNDIFRFVLG